MDIELLTSIIDFLPDATFVVDNDEKVVIWNKAMEKMTGLDRKDILGKDNYEYSIPFYRERRPTLINCVFKKDDIRKRYNYVKQDGNIIYGETFVSALNAGSGAHLWGIAAALFDNEGNLKGAIESIRDITQRKVMEMKLRDSEEKLRTIFDQTFQFMALLTSDGSLIAVNKTALDFVEVTEADVLGRKFWDTPWWQHSVESQEQLKTAVKQSTSGDYIAFETTLLNKRGVPHIFEVSLKPIKDKDGKVIYLNAESRDITATRETEKALRQEKDRFLTLTEEAPFGIMLVNKESRCTYLNARFKEMFGYDIEDVPDGRTWCRKAYPNTKYRHVVIKAWLDDVEKFKRQPSLRESNRWTFMVTCKDKSVKVINFISVVLPTDEYLITLEDITQQKMAEEEVERRGIELDIKSKNLEEVNAALRVLLKERENDKARLEEKILANVKELVMPYIEKLKKCHLDPGHQAYIDIIQENLNDIISPFVQNMGLKYTGLTPTELEIANLIKNGKRTKEIGEALHMSQGAINFHRNNIRKKLGLTKKKINLRSCLLSLQKI